MPPASLTPVQRFDRCEALVVRLDKIVEAIGRGVSVEIAPNAGP